MTTSITKTVGVTFTGDIAPLTESMDKLVDEAKTTASEMADAFAPLGEKIVEEWSDLGKTIGTKLDEAGDAAGKSGVDSITKQYSDAAEDIVGEWGDLGEALGENLASAGKGAGEVGVKALVDKYGAADELIDGELSDLEKTLQASLVAAGAKAGEAGTKALSGEFAGAGTQAASELDDFAVEVGKTLDGQAGTAGKAAAADLAEPFGAAGATAGDDFASRLKAALGGINAEGETVGGDFAKGFDTGADLGESMKWPSAITAGTAGDEAGKAFSESFDKWAASDEMTWPVEGAGPAGALAGREYGAAFRDAAAPAEAEASAGGGEVAAAEGGGGGLLAALMDPEVIGPIIAAAASLKVALDFQSASEHLVTDGGESQKALGMIEQGMLDLSASTGTSTANIVDGMYYIESAGIHGSNALLVLKAAAEGAKVGGADLNDVAFTLATTMNAYNLPASQAVAVMDELVATTGAGDMKMQDLAASLHSVAPLAASVGISLAQVGGALATMTGQGMSADQATQNLANTIRSLSSPNHVAITEMAQMGLNSNTLAKNLGKQGLTGTLSEVYEAIMGHMGPSGEVMLKTFNQSTGAIADMQIELKAMSPAVKKVADEFMNGQLTASQFRSALPANLMPLAQGFVATYTQAHKFNAALTSGSPAAQTFEAALSKIMGGATGLSTSLLLTGPHMAQFKNNVSTIQGAADGAGKSVKNWSVINETTNQKLDELGASIEVLGVHLGTVLIPVLDKVLDAGIKVLGWVTDFVVYLEGHKAAAIAFGAAIAIAFAPFFGIPLLIAGVVAAGVELVDHWKPIETFFVDLGKKVWGALDGAWHKVETDATTTWDAINHFFSGIPDKIVGFFLKWNIVGIILSHWNAIEADAKAAWDSIQKFVEGVPMKIGTSLASTFAGIATEAYRIWTNIANFMMKVPGEIVGFFQKWTLVQLINKAWSDIESGAATAWSKTLTFLESIPSKVLHLFEGFDTLLVDAGKALLDGLWKGISDGVGGLLGHITGVGGDVLKGFKSVLKVFSPSTETQKIGQHLLQGLDAGVQDASEKSNIMNSIATLGTSMLANLRSLIPQFTTVGQQLMQGLASGIASAASQVATATAAAATAALASAKAATKTASPSQAFAELGENLMAGLAQGVMASASLARGAVTNVTGGLTSAASLSGHGAGGGSGINITGPLVVVQSPSGTLPASTIEQVGQVVQEGLKSWMSAYGNALRVSGA